MSLLSHADANPAVATRRRAAAAGFVDGLTSSLPSWTHLIRDDAARKFFGDQLVHRDFSNDERLNVQPAGQRGALHRWLVDHFWAARKNSHVVKRVLRRLVDELDANDWGLNLGAGETSYGANILNLDIYDSTNIQIVKQGCRLPLKDNSLASGFSNTNRVLVYSG